MPICVLIGRFDSDEQLVPFLVFARCGGTASRKGPVQQLEIRDQALLCPAPVGQLLAARSGHLVPKELDQAFMNSIVVRFDDTLAVFLSKPEQAFLLDGGPDDRIDVRVDYRRHESSLYAYLLARSYPAQRLSRQDASHRRSADLETAGDLRLADASAV